jgi:hypothetical protein
MIRRWLDPGSMDVWYAPSKAWEVTGPGVHTLLVGTTVATVVLAVALLVVWGRALARRSVLSTEALVWVTLASTMGFIALGRVLSPQYLLWLGPAVAAGLLVVERTRAALVRWTCGLLVAAALTHLVFPLLYGPLLDDRTGGLAVAVLAVRNLTMLVLLATSARHAWRCLAPETGTAPAARSAEQPGETRAADVSGNVPA